MLRFRCGDHLFGPVGLIASSGYNVQFIPGKGPVVDEPIVSAACLDRPSGGRGRRPWVRGRSGGPNGGCAAGRRTHDRIRLAPFTLASYLIEGGSSKQFMKTKAFLHQEPAAAKRLFDTQLKSPSTY